MVRRIDEIRARVQQRYRQLWWASTVLWSGCAAALVVTVGAYLAAERVSVVLGVGCVALLFCLGMYYTRRTRSFYQKFRLWL